MLARDVDRHISRRPVEHPQQNARLGAGPTAELDQPAVWTDLCGDRGRVLFEDRDLGAGRIIFREATNRLEQRRATSVVEEFAWDRFGGAAEPVEHSVAKALLAGCEVVKRKARAADHPRSSASRSPEKAQREDGGKKFR